MPPTEATYTLNILRLLTHVNNDEGYCNYFSQFAFNEVWLIQHTTTNFDFESIGPLI